MFNTTSTHIQCQKYLGGQSGLEIQKKVQEGPGPELFWHQPNKGYCKKADAEVAVPLMATRGYPDCLS